MASPELLALIAYGASLGLTGALTPGPLSTVMVSETMAHGKLRGALFALAPLLTDLPVLLAFVIGFTVLQNGIMLWAAGFLGGAYLVYLGVRQITEKQNATKNQAGKKSALRKALTVNAANPNLYIFMGSVMAPQIVQDIHDPLLSAAFFASFLLFLVGGNLGVVVAVDRGRTFFESQNYRFILQALGVLLVFFGGRLLYAALQQVFP
ncbi:LysE family transporter [Candidatus Micrarchaeota archaeon]|nr:LysE family transporter [Candidatus Micrarchaeota archaeon]